MKLFKKNILMVMAAAIFIVGWIILWPKDHNQHLHKHNADVYYCPMHPNYTSHKPGNCPICNMKLVKRETTPEPGKNYVAAGKSKNTQKKILYWTDPMIPGYKASGPGKSPMGMDLIPVYEQAKTEGDAVQGHASISLDSAKQHLIGIKTQKVSMHELTKVIRASGTVAHDRELYQTEAEYLQAIAALKRAQASNIPEVLEQAEEVVGAVHMRLIHMGFNDGLIEELAQKNELDHSLLLGDTGPIWVYAYIYQYELPYIDVGTPVKVEVPSFKQETFEGMVRAVDPMVDAMTRTVRVRILVKDAKGVLKPDMYVDARMDVDLGKVLAVPQEAIFHTGTQDIVFVDKGNGILQPQEVTLGAEAKGFFEIKSGLKQGERVVTSGNFLIDSESRLKAAMEGMSDSGRDSHGQ